MVTLEGVGGWWCKEGVGSGVEGVEDGGCVETGRTDPSSPKTKNSSISLLLLRPRSHLGVT